MTAEEKKILKYQKPELVDFVGETAFGHCQNGGSPQATCNTGTVKGTTCTMGFTDTACQSGENAQGTCGGGSSQLSCTDGMGAAGGCSGGSTG